MAKAVLKDKAKLANSSKYLKYSNVTNYTFSPPSLSLSLLFVKKKATYVSKKKQVKSKEISDLMRHHDSEIIKLTKSKNKLLRSSASAKGTSKPLARK